MSDIRIVRTRGSRIWLWSASLAGLALLVLLLSYVFGDPTEQRRDPKKEQALNAARAPVAPLRPVSFENIVPLGDRQIGRLLHLTGVAQSGLVSESIWVKSRDGRRLLVRFNPKPPEGALRGMGYGSTVEVDGYVSKIGRAELDAWLDSLRVVLPRPEPGIKFGDLPDSTFARIDSLFVKTYYLSVRPSGIGGIGKGVVVPPRRPRPAAPASGVSTDSTPAQPLPIATPPPAPAADSAPADSAG